MAKKNVFEIRGVANWAKVLGEPVPNYGGDNREWTIDLTPDEKGVQVIQDLGLADRMRNKKDDRGDFFVFRQREKRLDGSLNRRISVTDVTGQPWPQDKLIGNGSTVDVKFEFKDYGAGKKPGVYPQAIRVLDYKEYARQEFAPLSEDDPFYEPPSNFEGQLPDEMEPEGQSDEEFPE